MINKKQRRLLLTALMLMGISLSSIGQTTVTEPWTANQLMPPAELAKVISDKNAKQPIVLCIGPGALIIGSIDIGPAHEQDGMAKLKEELSKLPKNANIVIYCGCCPFERCPNIRPAFQLMKDMKFTNQKLLNLETNLKTDWIAKGYPVSQ